MVPRSDFTKKCLADSLLKLMKEGKRLDSISIQDIVEQAGFSRMAYYRNFKEKGDIIRYQLDLITEDFINKSNLDFYRMPFDEYLVSVLTLLFNHRDLSNVLINTNMFDYVKEQFDTRLIREARSNEQKQRYIFFAGGLFNIYTHWLQSGGVDTPEEVARILCRFVPKP